MSCQIGMSINYPLFDHLDLFSHFFSFQYTAAESVEVVVDDDPESQGAKENAGVVPQKNILDSRCTCPTGTAVAYGAADGGAGRSSEGRVFRQHLAANHHEASSQAGRTTITSEGGHPK